MNHVVSSVLNCPFKSNCISYQIFFILLPNTLHFYVKGHEFPCRGQLPTHSAAAPKLS